VQDKSGIERGEHLGGIGNGELRLVILNLAWERKLPVRKSGMPVNVDPAEIEARRPGVRRDVRQTLNEEREE
jgi:hypothetical protein